MLDFMVDFVVFYGILRSVWQIFTVDFVCRTSRKSLDFLFTHLTLLELCETDLMCFIFRLFHVILFHIYRWSH